MAKQNTLCIPQVNSDSLLRTHFIGEDRRILWKTKLNEPAGKGSFFRESRGFAAVKRPPINNTTTKTHTKLNRKSVSKQLTGCLHNWILNLHAHSRLNWKLPLLCLFVFGDSPNFWDHSDGWHLQSGRCHEQILGVTWSCLLRYLRLVAIDTSEVNWIETSLSPFPTPKSSSLTCQGNALGTSLFTLATGTFH